MIDSVAMTLDGRCGAKEDYANSLLTNQTLKLIRNIGNLVKQNNRLGYA